jgi:hypothetical protein
MEEGEGGGGFSFFHVIAFVLFAATFAYKTFVQRYREQHGPDAPVPDPLTMLRMVIQHGGIPDEPQEGGSGSAEAGGLRTVNVTLPAQPPFEVGDVLQLVADGTGELVEIQVPQGAGPGSVLQVEIPDERGAAAAEPEVFGNVRADERRPSGASNNNNLRPTANLRRANTASEHIVSAVSGHSDLSDQEWHWLKVIIGCTIWLVCLSTALVFGGRMTRKVKP